MVLDASVAIHWVSAGMYQRQAANVLALPGQLAAPGLFLSEVANVLFKSVRDRAISEEQARGAHDQIRRTIHTLIPVTELHD